MVAKAQRSGDLTGYEDALRLLLEAATRASPGRPGAWGEALSACAMCRFELSRLMEDAGHAERLYTEAVADAERALKLSRQRSLARTQRTIELARIRGARVKGSDLDEAIRCCRRALLLLWRVGERQHRSDGYLALAELLARRAELASDRGADGISASLRITSDRQRATRLFALVLGDLAPLARIRHVELAQRLGAGGHAVTLFRPRLIRRLHQRRFAEQSRLATPLALDQAEGWVRWATEREDTQQLAEAHWGFIAAAVKESRRGIFWAQRERRLSRIQGQVAEAGASLVAAGRARDAAVALELGRAVLVTDRMHREPDELEERLVRAGRDDLAERCRVVVEAIARMDRDAYGASPPEASTIDPAGRASAGALLSAEHVTHAEYEQLLREISRVPGFEDVDASPTYHDLRAAACDGPFVYVFAAERKGYALVLTEGPEPVVVELPLLRATEVNAHASRLLQAQDAHEMAGELETQLPWLWKVVLQPLVAHLQPPALVTLVPVGALGQLPIHAAVAARDEDGVWRDQTGGLVFRYAPNARVFLRARAAAGRAPGVEKLRLLTVAVPDGPDGRRLPRAEDESHGIVALFGEHRTTRPSPAALADVVAALDACAIWHFACHGEHDLTNPLESHLQLADGPLTLRSIFARPHAVGRLAVLSACETAMFDETLLDEVIGFPSALLQNGIGGVASFLAPVEDEAAMLLVLRFFSRLRDGVAPARALAEAQAWLRCATNEQIHDAFPHIYRVTGERAGDDFANRWEQRRFTDPRDWATFGYWGC